MLCCCQAVGTRIQCAGSSSVWLGHPDAQPVVKTVQEASREGLPVGHRCSACWLQGTKQQHVAARCHRPDCDSKLLHGNAWDVLSAPAGAPHAAAMCLLEHHKFWPDQGSPYLAPTTLRPPRRCWLCLRGDHVKGCCRHTNGGHPVELLCRRAAGSRCRGSPAYYRHWCRAHRTMMQTSGRQPWDC